MPKPKPKPEPKTSSVLIKLKFNYNLCDVSTNFSVKNANETALSRAYNIYIYLLACTPVLNGIMKNNVKQL